MYDHEEAFAGSAQDELFARSLAQQALRHPTWELDDLVDWLEAAGFNPSYVARHNRAILEAMHRARELAVADDSHLSQA